MTYTYRHVYMMCTWCVHDDGQRYCPKHVEFYTKNKIWDISASRWFYYKNISWCMILWMSNSTAYCYTHFLSDPTRYSHGKHIEIYFHPANSSVSCLFVYCVPGETYQLSQKNCLNETHHTKSYVHSNKHQQRS